MECGFVVFIGIIILFIAAMNDHTKRQAREKLIDINLAEVRNLKQRIGEIEKTFKSQVLNLQNKIRTMERSLEKVLKNPLPVAENLITASPGTNTAPNINKKMTAFSSNDKPKQIPFKPLSGKQKEKESSQTPETSSKSTPKIEAETNNLQEEKIEKQQLLKPEQQVKTDRTDESPEITAKQNPAKENLNDNEEGLKVTGTYFKNRQPAKHKSWEKLIEERRKKEKKELAALITEDEKEEKKQEIDDSESTTDEKPEKNNEPEVLIAEEAVTEPEKKEESPEPSLALSGNSKTPGAVTSINIEPVTPAYSEKASRLEMDIAGKWVSIAGIIMIMAGMIFFLRQALQATNFSIIPHGLPQVLFGALLGIVLIILGSYFHRKDMITLGHSLIAGGFCVLFFTVSAAHFYFHLVNSFLVGMLFFMIIVSSGMTIFKLNSKIIAATVLIIAFITPFLMMFRLENLTLLYVYLLAINLGVVFVAYHKKWDGYIMAAFLLTYFHYFWNFKYIKGNTATTLTFLSLFYMIFLLSNNLYHFKKKVSGGFNMFITYFNPLLFGCISYYFLMKSPNWQALSTYISLSLIHLFIASKARSLEEHDPSFEAMTRTNLVLGLMFLTTAVSFITFFTDTDQYFSLVTALWWIEAFVLMKISLKIGFCDRIIRRFSYLTIGIIWAQLISVVSWMPQDTSWQMIHKFSIYFVSMILFYGFFRLMYYNRHEMEKEDNWMMAAVLISCLGIVIYLTYSFYNIYALMLLLATVGYIILYMSVKFSDRLQNFKYVSYGMFTLVSVMLIIYSIINPEFTPMIFSSAALEKAILMTLTGLVFFGNFLTIYKYRDSLKDFFHGLVMEISLITPLIILYFIGEKFLTIYAKPLLALVLASLPIVLSFEFEERMKNLRRLSNLVFFAAPVFIFILDIMVAGGYARDSIYNISFAGKAVLYVLTSLVYAGYFHFLRQKKSQIKETDYVMFSFSVIAVFTIMLSLFNTIFTGFGLLLMAAFLTNIILYLVFKFPGELKQIKKLPYIFMGIITAIALFCPFKTMALPFLNGRFMALLGVAFMFFNAWYFIRKNEDKLTEIHTWYHHFMWGIISIVLMKAILLENYGMGATFIWCLLGIGILALSKYRVKNEKLELIAFLILSFALVKSLVYDSSAISLADKVFIPKIPGKFAGASKGAEFIASAYTFYHSSAMVIDIILVLLTGGIYYIASHLKAEDPKLRDVYQAFSLIILAFQSSAIMFRVYGVLDEFQVILTVFWGAISLLSIIIGLTIGRKIFRLFGLVLLAASTAKIIFVDIWVLKFYFMAFPLLVMGGMMIATSFLYQKYKDQLTDEPLVKKMLPEKSVV